MPPTICDKGLRHDLYAVSVPRHAKRHATPSTTYILLGEMSCETVSRGTENHAPLVCSNRREASSANGISGKDTNTLSKLLFSAGAFAMLYSLFTLLLFCNRTRDAKTEMNQESPIPCAFTHSFEQVGYQRGESATSRGVSAPPAQINARGKQCDNDPQQDTPSTPILRVTLWR